MAWLPPAPPGPDLGSLPPWEPAEVRERLGDGAPWDALSYIVIDELHEGVAGLVIGPWPRLDPQGRLVFGGEEESRRVATSADELLAVLRRERLPVVPVPVDRRTEEQLRERELSIGDVFAARLGGVPGGDPASWPGGPVLDITAEAREMAKAQASATALGVIDQKLIEAIGEELGEDEQPR
jgi:hypothetical protein